jgi:hypothetical protein
MPFTNIILFSFFCHLLGESLKGGIIDSKVNAKVPLVDIAKFPCTKALLFSVHNSEKEKCSVPMSSPQSACNTCEHL